ncbi:MAG: N-acetyltransferase [bacterium]|nr:N-acetyltransferase [bacterium]
MSTIEIIPVERPVEDRAFVELGFRLNAKYPQFANQLQSDVLKVLDRTANPFWQRAERQLFLAKKDGELVGRIAAIDNHAHNECHDENVGHWGYFECTDNQEVANALFHAAEQWVLQRGRDKILGPMNPSTNDECGMLIDAFDQPPVIMMTWNPEYYLKLVENAGHTKAKDLYAWWFVQANVSERYRRGAELIQRRTKAVIRSLNMDRFEEDVALVKTIYNMAWEKNWGFFPMTDAEMNHLAKALKPIVVPDLCIFAFIDDKPVGFSLTLPDYYQAMRYIRDGKLMPFGWLKLLWHIKVAKTITQLRMLVMGILPEYRSRGIDVLLYHAAIEAANRLGYQAAELSWILEDNTMMNQILENLNAKLYKRYRIYTKDLR